MSKPFDKFNWGGRDESKPKEEFKQFLKDNEAYDRFIDNFYYHLPPEVQSLEGFLDGMPKNLWILNAFVLGSTFEGLDYWAYISTKWQQKLDSIGH